ncbi:MAG: T9SS type A sorting domain-containing protein [Sphingobacteriales bacterium]|nr:MAG: T9SS type A sorting domain-containing protein [Sphingobacteriales bacterium]
MVLRSLKKASISVYPNPASDVVYVNAPVKTILSLTEMSGRLLLPSTQSKQLLIKSLAPGVYLLHIADVDGRKVKTEKIVRQ